MTKNFESYLPSVNAKKAQRRTAVVTLIVIWFNIVNSMNYINNYNIFSVTSCANNMISNDIRLIPLWFHNKIQSMKYLKIKICYIHNIQFTILTENHIIFCLTVILYLSLFKHYLIY